MLHVVKGIVPPEEFAEAVYEAILHTLESGEAVVVYAFSGAVFVATSVPKSDNCIPLFHTIPELCHFKFYTNFSFSCV